jgi:acyl transferase domain-containing protein
MDALEPIAIVGLAVRFPGDAENVESFWDILCNKRSTLTEIPKDRFNVDAFWHPSGGRGGSVRIARLFLNESS